MGELGRKCPLESSKNMPPFLSAGVIRGIYSFHDVLIRLEDGKTGGRLTTSFNDVTWCINLRNKVHICVILNGRQ